MSGVLVTASSRALPVAKKKADKIPPTGPRQVNFRPSDALYRRLERVARTFEIDVSNLVRMVLTESLHSYEQRAQAIEQEQERQR